MMSKRFVKIISIMLIIGFALSISAPLVLAQQTSNQPSQTTSSSGAAPKKGGGVLDWLFSTAISIFSKPLLLVFDIITEALSIFFALIIKLEALLINYLIGAFGFTTAQIVKTGWGIMRDLANMVLIFALIIIAISYILDIEAGKSPTLLWHVVTAAVLVNFSLIIAGVIIDFTQVVMTYFLNAATGGNPVQLSERLANAMNITAFYNPGTGSVLASTFREVNIIWLSAAGLLLKLIALVIMTFVFGATAIFLILRVAWLWLLLIAAPLAWALRGVPGQERYWDDWWHNFFKWAFFGPIYAVCIFLALSIFTAGGTIGVFSNLIPQGWAKPDAYVEASAPQALLQFVLMTILLMAPLFIADKLGYMGAKGAMGTIKGWGEGTKNFAGRQLRRAAVSATAPIPPGTPAGRFRKIGATLGGVATAIPGLRGAYLGITAAEAKTVEGYKDELKGVPTEFLARTLATSPTLIGRRKLAYAEMLAEKGKLNTGTNPAFNTAFITSMLQLAQKEGRAKNILGVAPDLASLINQTVASVVKKIPFNKAENIREEAFAYRNTAQGNKPEVVLNLSGGHLDRIAKEGSPELRNTVKDAIENAFNDLGTVITGLTPQETDKILNMAVHIQSSPLWNI